MPSCRGRSNRNRLDGYRPDRRWKRVPSRRNRWKLPPCSKQRYRHSKDSCQPQHSQSGLMVWPLAKDTLHLKYILLPHRLIRSVLDFHDHGFGLEHTNSVPLAGGNVQSNHRAVGTNPNGLGTDSFDFIIKLPYQPTPKAGHGFRGVSVPVEGYGQAEAKPCSLLQFHYIFWPQRLILPIFGLQQYRA